MEGNSGTEINIYLNRFTCAAEYQWQASEFVLTQF